MMKKQRIVRSQIKNLRPSERPDPFKPAESYYHDRTSYVPEGDHCRVCWDNPHRRPVPAAQDHDLLKRWADWKYPSRDDICDKTFRRKKNEDII